MFKSSKLTHRQLQNNSCISGNDVKSNTYQTNQNVQKAAASHYITFSQYAAFIQDFTNNKI